MVFELLKTLYISYLRSFSLLVQRKRTKRKDTFSKVFLSKKWTKPQGFPKFSTRLRKFLTENLVILRKKTISNSIFNSYLRRTDIKIIRFREIREKAFVV